MQNIIDSIVNSRPDHFYKIILDLFNDTKQELKYNRYIRLDSPNEVLVETRRINKGIYDRIIDAMESTTGLPVNAFTAVEFEKWNNDFDFFDIIQNLDSIKATASNSIFRLCFIVSYFDPLNDGTMTCHLQVTASIIVQKEDTKRIFPFYERKFLLSQYSGLMT